MRKFFIVLAIGFCSFFVLPQIYFITQSQSLNIDEPQVVYPLPYPGILSDSPLFFAKEWRDSILIFTTRDSLKKAQLYLHLSDKYMAIALELAKKGKEDLAKKELITPEDYFLSIPKIVKDSKEQGNGASADFVNTLNQSNAKHKEVITEVMKSLNQAEIETFKTILQKNKEAQKELQSL
jgi:hypothetical protein